MGGPEDTPEPASQVRETGKGTYEQEKAPDTTDDAWQRGMTPMVALRYEEDASDAPTVIGGEVEEMPDLDALFPIGGRKKAAAALEGSDALGGEPAAPAAEAPSPAPVTDQAVATAVPVTPAPKAPAAAPSKASAPATAASDLGSPALGYGLLALGVVGVIGLILAFAFGA